MKFITANITSILVLVVAVLTTMIIMSTCRKSVPDEKLIRLEMETEFKDREIKIIETDREKLRAGYDSILSVLSSRDDQKANEVKKIIYQYEKIPVYINSLNRDSLRAAVNRYPLLPD